MASGVAEGLEGIVVTETTLSEVDGERGRLIIAGHDVEALAGELPFEALLGLLWTGSVPSERERADRAAELGKAREVAFERLSQLEPALRLPDGMDALRAAVASFPSEAAGLPEGVLLTAAIAVSAAAWTRRRARSSGSVTWVSRCTPRSAFPRRTTWSCGASRSPTAPAARGWSS